MTARSSPRTRTPAANTASLVEAPDDLDELNRFFDARRWGDGLPIVPPTPTRVTKLLSCLDRAAEDVVAVIAPGFGTATVENIAINAVLAGCRPEYLPVLIAAVEAISAPEFNLQGIQATTNPAAVWMILNGPIAGRLGITSGHT